MNLPDNLFPAPLYWLAHPLYLLIIGYAVYRAPWKRLQQNEYSHVFLGSCVAILFLWNLKAGIHPGLNFHLLGGTLLLLMFDWPFAMIGGSLVMLGTSLGSLHEWHSFSLNALLMVIIPVAISYGVLRLSVRYLPHHFFIYTIFNGYFTGGMAMLITIVLTSLLLMLFGPYSFDFLKLKYLPFTPMMIFAEGFFTGMLATSMALFRPQWITTFDDKRYLVGK